MITLFAGCLWQSELKRKSVNREASTGITLQNREGLLLESPPPSPPSKKKKKKISWSSGKLETSGMHPTPAASQSTVRCCAESSSLSPPLQVSAAIERHVFYLSAVLVRSESDNDCFSCCQLKQLPGRDEAGVQLAGWMHATKDCTGWIHHFSE